MNEDRYRNILNISGKTENPLEQDWNSLSARLQTLMQRVKPFYRKDILDEILKLIKVLSCNKPNKKVYNSVLNKVLKLELAIRELGGRIR